MNYSPFIYALDQQNIAITGGGTLDGQANAENWWPWKGRRAAASDEPNQNKARAALVEMVEKGTPVAERKFGDGGYLRPMFVQPYRCTNVQIEDITIVNSPMYEMHPVLCRNFTVRNVTVSSHGPNNDGCDPESSRRRADRWLHLRYRRRLHRHQERAQRRWPPPARAEREPDRAELHDEGRPRRRHHGQRMLRRHPQRVRAGLPDGQPATWTACCASRTTRSAAA